jgi:excisionase family DNA binding protein
VWTDENPARHWRILMTTKPNAGLPAATPVENVTEVANNVLPRFVSVDELAAMLGVNRATIYEWEASGVLPPHFTPGGEGGRRRYLLDEVMQYLREGRDRRLRQINPNDAVHGEPRPAKLGRCKER